MRSRLGRSDNEHETPGVGMQPKGKLERLKRIEIDGLCR
jgi:hypothetical protein